MSFRHEQDQLFTEHVGVHDRVMAQIRGKVDLQLVDCGHQRFKETDAPIHVYKTRAADDRSAQGLFDFDDEESKDTAISGGCICGATRYEIGMPAISTGYCHCRICQRFSGSAMSAWTAFPASAVQFLTGEPRYFASSPIARRGYCPECGASLTYQLMRPQPASYIVVFTTSLDAPQDYSPTAHGGIESKLPWLDVLDDLPRTSCAESRSLQKAWASVGLPDPADWGPGAKLPMAF